MANDKGLSNDLTAIAEQAIEQTMQRVHGAMENYFGSLRQIRAFALAVFVTVTALALAVQPAIAGTGTKSFTLSSSSGKNVTLPTNLNKELTQTKKDDVENTDEPDKYSGRGYKLVPTGYGRSKSSDSPAGLCGLCL